MPRALSRGMPTTIYGLYKSHDQAERSVSDLLAAGFGKDEISLLTSREGGFTDEREDETRGDRAASAAVGGAAIGGTFALLAGFGTIVIPGAGILLAAGPILTTLMGLGVGAGAGGIVGALTGAGLPEHHAKDYELLMQNGGTLVVVHSRDAQRADDARVILARHGAESAAAAS